VSAASGLVIADKPSGWTSHDVVARIRRLAGTRRVGHAGTLDPMATGVLVVGVEKATRLLGHLALTEKEYNATIRLGASTDTDDADGQTGPVTPAAGLPRAALDAAVAGLTGEIMQVPPGVSAIKVSGQRAYRLARAGAAPELAARAVTVSKLDVRAVRAAGDFLDLDVAVTCSSGTYIRAIARDLGAGLGVGGHLTALRRTRVGPYPQASARTMDQLAEAFELLPLADAAAAAFRRRDLTAAEARTAGHGGRLAATGPAATGPAATGPAVTGAAATGAAATGAGGTGGDAAAAGLVAGFAPDGSLIALLADEGGQARPVAVFVP
jgi:tRNA pseudouridine55 synthase